MPLYCVLARYTGDGGYWSDDVWADNPRQAEAYAAEIMEENGGTLDEVVDCDLVTVETRAKRNATHLLTRAKAVLAYFEESSQRELDVLRDLRGIVNEIEIEPAKPDEEDDDGEE